MLTYRYPASYPVFSDIVIWLVKPAATSFGFFFCFLNFVVHSMVYFKALFYYYFGVTGIPTVKREFQSYLVPTLQSVFDNMSQVINF